MQLVLAHAGEDAVVADNNKEGHNNKDGLTNNLRLLYNPQNLLHR